MLARAAVALVAISGCAVEVDYGGTRFACVQDNVCPPGFECLEGLCLPEGEVRDAGADGIDAPVALRHALSVGANLSESLADAPVLVRLTPERIDYARVAGDGADLRFVDPGGARLAHEIERWDPAGESVVWVRLPVLETGASFEMIYGDGAASAERPDAVWSRYQLVYHLEDGAESRQGLDATAQNGASFDAGGGRIAGAAILDGVDDHLLIGEDLPLMRGVSAGTISAWVKLDPIGASILEVAINGGLSSRIFANVTSEGFPQLGVRTQDEAGSSLNAEGTTAVDAGEWVWVLGTAEFSAGTVVVYADGVEVGRAEELAFDPATPDTNASIAVIGIDEGLSVGMLSGSIDEVRLSAQAATPGWVEAQYLSMTDALLDYGPAQ